MAEVAAILSKKTLAENGNDFPPSPNTPHLEMDRINVPLSCRSPCCDLFYGRTRITKHLNHAARISSLIHIGLDHTAELG